MTDEEAIRTYLHSDDYGIEEIPPKHRCKNCKEGIWEGDEYYLVGEELLCPTCMESIYKYLA